MDILAQYHSGDEGDSPSGSALSDTEGLPVAKKTKVDVAPEVSTEVSEKA